MTPLTEQEVLDVLHAIERGEVTLDWIVTVEKDHREWDHLEEVETPDGRVLPYDELSDRMPELGAYKPSNPTLWGLDR